MKKPGKERLDKLVFDLGLAESRHKAQALIMAGSVLVEGQRVDKAGTQVSIESAVTIKQGLPFVSRGGLKLDGALKEFDVDVTGLTVMDVGSSTGGFTDCLLKRRAHRVIAIDVGRGIMDATLASDDRVTLIEGVNIRYVSEEDFSAILGTDNMPAKVDMAVIDVSFISLKKVVPKVVEFLEPGASILALVKPQFEVGKGEVGKGGIVRDPEKHRAVLADLESFFTEEGLGCGGVCDSPIHGAKGNKEFFMLLKKAA